MKKIIVILCLVSIGVTGCINQEEATENNAKTEYDISQNISEEEQVQQLTLTDMSFDSEYSDGYAWIKLSSEEYSRMDGMVNKEGEIVAAIPTQNHGTKEYKGHSEFDEGYAFLFFDTEVGVIDTNGDIISTQQLEEDNQLAAYGAGYIVIENHIHDFDYNTYEYVFYNPQGEEVTTYTPDDGESHEVSYMGGGVFSFGVYDGSYTNDIYFSATNKWVRHRISTAKDDDDSDFENSHHITFDKSDRGIIYCNWPGGEGGVLTIADKNGNITEYNLSLTPCDTKMIRTCSIVRDNYCLIVDGTQYGQYGSISVLDLNTGIQTELSETYKVGQVWDELGMGNRVYFEDDVFSIPLQGEDNETYIGFFDVNCNLISDPIRIDDYRQYSFSDGRLVAVEENDDIAIYSIDGKEIYTVNGKDKTNLSDNIEKEYSDDVFVDIESELGDIGVYDQDGNILYTTLDTVNTKILSIGN